MSISLHHSLTAESVGSSRVLISQLYPRCKWHPCTLVFQGCREKSLQTRWLKIVFYSHISGGQKSEINVLPRWFFLVALRENTFPAFLWATGGGPQSLASLGLSMPHFNHCLYIHITVFSVFLCLLLFCLFEGNSIGFWSHPNPGWSDLEPYFFIECYFK